MVQQALPRPLLLLLVGLTLGAVACPDPSPLVDGGAGDGGVIDGGSTPEVAADCSLPIGPPCCNDMGERVTSAECVDEAWSCPSGAVCSCEGEPASFICSDTCGSDAFLDPECGAEGWQCPAGLISSRDCPENICWGDPGECCVNPSCVDGAWTCESIRDPC